MTDRLRLVRANRYSLYKATARRYVKNSSKTDKNKIFDFDIRGNKKANFVIFERKKCFRNSSKKAIAIVCILINNIVNLYYNKIKIYLMLQFFYTRTRKRMKFKIEKTMNQCYFKNLNLNLSDLQFIIYIYI